MKKYGFGVDIGGTTCRPDYLRPAEKCWISGKSQPTRQIMADIF